MFTRIRQWLAPPVFDDEDKTRIAGLLNVLLLMLLAATVVGTAIVLPLEPEEWVFNAIFGVLLTGLFLWFRALVRRGRLGGVSYVLATVLWLSMTTLVVMGEGVRDASVVGYFLVITLASLLLGARGVLIYGLLSAAAIAGLFIAEAIGLYAVTPAPTATVANWMVITLVMLLTALLLRTAMAAINSAVMRSREKEIALAESNRALQENSLNLEVRTQELERRTGQLHAVTELGRATTTLRDQDALCAAVPRLICERLSLDYVSLLLLNVLGDQLVVRGAYNRAGNVVSAQGRALALPDESVLAQVWAAGEGQLLAAVVDSDFPETRSRLVLPVAVGERVLGVLDLHSHTPGALEPEDMAVLQGLADQLGLALEGISLLTETQLALEKAQRAYGEASSQAWRELLQASLTPGFRSHERGVTPAEVVVTPEIQHALRAQQPVHVPGDGQRDHLLILPIQVRDTVIGVVDTYKPADGPGWSESEINLLQELAAQLGVALEGARLYQDTQRRAARERVIREISDRMQQAVDMEALMRITAEEVHKVLGGTRAYVRIGAPDAAPLAMQLDEGGASDAS